MKNLYPGITFMRWARTLGVCRWKRAGGHVVGRESMLRHVVYVSMWGWGCQSWLCHLLAVCHWAIHLTCLRFILLRFKMKRLLVLIGHWTTIMINLKIYGTVYLLGIILVSGPHHCHHPHFFPSEVTYSVPPGQFCVAMIWTRLGRGWRDTDVLWCWATGQFFKAGIATFTGLFPHTPVPLPTSTPALRPPTPAPVRDPGFPGGWC